MKKIFNIIIRRISEGFFHHIGGALAILIGTLIVSIWLSITPKPQIEQLAEKASKESLNEREIQGLSKSELRILRNWIYAKHGYIFDDKKLDKYFSKYEWYEHKDADATYIYNNLLNSAEKYNISFIKERENGI